MTVIVTDHYLEKSVVFHGVKTVIEGEKSFKLQYANNKLSKEYRIPAFSYTISIDSKEENK